MNPLSKFAVFLTLAGVLAVLFAFVPDHRQPLVPRVSPAVNLPPQEPRSEPAADPGRKAAESPGKSSAIIGPKNVASSADPRVKVPAIRGLNRYGWVQLPMGTRVELVREDAAGLLVRWDGTLTRLSPTAERSGAIVVVRKAAM